MTNQVATVIAFSRFRALWLRTSTVKSGDRARLTYDLLVTLHNEHWRRYHALRHITHCLTEFDRIECAVGALDAVEMALWFHDAIYVPGSADNEQRSAELFNLHCGDYLAPAFVESVCELILITRHPAAPRDEAQRYIIDIDLSSFGLPWADFLRDSQHVRDEQSALSDAEYYAAHRRFLTALNSRSRIYHTDVFYSLYEQIARDNIARLLALESSR